MHSRLQNCNLIVLLVCMYNTFLPTQPSLAAISTRVEQLTLLVEKMSARFVILETQLKLVGSHPLAERKSPTMGHSQCPGTDTQSGGEGDNSSNTGGLEIQQPPNHSSTASGFMPPTKLLFTDPQAATARFQLEPTPSVRGSAAESPLVVTPVYPKRGILRYQLVDQGREERMSKVCCFEKLKLRVFMYCAMGGLCCIDIHC